MAYSARLRKAVGAVRATLSAVELCDVQAPEFAQHGDHAVAADAPLVLVACSGGRDSMALAAVSHIVCTSMGVRCGAVIVDHGLQAGSEQVASEAADRCHALGLGPVIMRNATVQARGEGLEAAARQARYDELCAAAHESGAIAVLLAHTMDDQGGNRIDWPAAQSRRGCVGWHAAGLHTQWRDFCAATAYPYSSRNHRHL